jgi:ADP-heptose:LPS heptosyltransferase
LYQKVYALAMIWICFCIFLRFLAGASSPSRSTAGAAPLLMAGITAKIWLRERYQRLYGRVRLAIEVLIIRLSAIGDVVHALPVAALLKRTLKDVRITWVVEPGAAGLLENNAAVDEVLIFPGKVLLRGIDPFHWEAKKLSEGLQFLRSLRSRHFDLAIDVQGLLKSSLLAILSGAPQRIGFKQAREFAPYLMTDLVDVGDYFGAHRHVVDHNLALAVRAIQLLGEKPEERAPVEFPLPSIDDQTRKNIEERLEAALGRAPNVLPTEKIDRAPHPLSSSQRSISPPVPGQGSDSSGLSSPELEAVVGLSSPWRVSALPPTTESPAAHPDEVGPNSIVSRPGPKASANLLGESSNGKKTLPPLAILIPGTTWSSKIWPVQQWTGLAQKLVEANYQIGIVGGPADIEANQLIEKELFAGTKGGVLNLTGSTSLLDLIPLFQVCDLVIGADTGPLHIAAATGKPKVVGIFGSTPSGRNGPYGKQGAAIALGLSCQPCFAKTCPLGTIACLKDMDYGYVFEQIQTLVLSST